MPMASIWVLSVMPSCFMASSSAGRPWVSQPKRRSTLLAALGLVAAHEVLGVAGQEVAVVRQAVGEGRAVVEDELVADPSSPASRWSMLAWKVPSWSQYLRMRSSISGNFTEADTPAALEAAVVEVRRLDGCGGGLGVISHLDILG